MTWICAYETRDIELALERLRQDGIVWRDDNRNDDTRESRKRKRRQRGRSQFPSEPGHSSRSHALPPGAAQGRGTT